MAALLWFLSLTWVLCGALPEARAHGRFPATSAVAAGPTDAHLAAVTTFGIVISDDGGASWSWICEEEVGYDDELTPSLAWPAPETLIVASPDGLAVSRDGGCTFAPHPAFAGRAPSDVARNDRAPTDVAVSTATFQAENGVFVSRDGAQTFLPALLRADVTFSAVAWSGDTLAALASGANGAGVLFTSEDDGATWRETPFRLGTDERAGDLAMDPEDRMRIAFSTGSATSGRVWWSADGGRHVAPALDLDEAIRSLAFSSGRVHVASRNGLHTSADGLGWTEAPHPRKNACVGRAGGSLVTCGWPWLDGWALAVAGHEMGGDHPAFAPLMQLTDISGPLSCPSSARCAVYWPALRAELKNLDPVPGADGGLVADAGSDAGIDSPPPPGPAAGAGCSCTARPSAPPTTAARDQPPCGSPGAGFALLAIAWPGLAATRRRLHRRADPKRQNGPRNPSAT